MGTIKPFNIEEMRVRASERVHKMFKGTPFIYVKYRDTMPKDMHSIAT